MEEALKRFKEAYLDLVDAWEHDISASKDYPFEVSFDEILIEKWVESTLNELEQRVDERITEALLGSRKDKIELILELELRKPTDLIYYSEEDLDKLLTQIQN